ncbi:MAG TPA: winged helix DNA-binding domain-containing protein [Mycobacteriales bacterium]|nr:winged helix DNA-binding domain-containing protein [Mycobacteriales bacterium]
MDHAPERRARLARRQLTAAVSALDAARSVAVLHATDPATVYLSVLARCPDLTLDDVAREMYDERRLVRMMAMRRTLFVVPAELVPVVHAAASLDVAATMRRRLLTQLTTLPTDPELPDDAAGWLADVEDGVAAAAARLGVASGAQLAKAEPRLQTAFLPTTDKAYDVRRAITSPVLVLVGAEGRLVRGRPLGSWTSRQHTWEPATAWWPDGIEPVDPARARVRLVEEYLRRFGPATEADVVWWTGWAKGTTRTALSAVDTVEHAGGLVLADDADPVEEPEPTATLLPALDPTPMGWKSRDWYLPADPSALYDSYGNVGPTLWWGGEVIGGWAVRKDGSVVTELLVDRGDEARAAVQDAAQSLSARLGGAVVVPSFRTPLERRLSAD